MGARERDVPDLTPDLSLLLMILSALALWAFLTLLVVALLLVLKTLEGVRTHLQRITMGVRAIEQQTAPLGALAGRLPPAMRELHASLDALAGRLNDASRHLTTVGPALRARLTSGWR